MIITRAYWPMCVHPLNGTQRPGDATVCDWARASRVVVAPPPNTTHTHIQEEWERKWFERWFVREPVYLLKRRKLRHSRTQNMLLCVCFSQHAFTKIKTDRCLTKVRDAHWRRAIINRPDLLYIDLPENCTKTQILSFEFYNAFDYAAINNLPVGRCDDACVHWNSLHRATLVTRSRLLTYICTCAGGQAHTHTHTHT